MSHPCRNDDEFPIPMPSDRGSNLVVLAFTFMFVFIFVLVVLEWREAVTTAPSTAPPLALLRRRPWPDA